MRNNLYFLIIVSLYLLITPNIFSENEKELGLFEVVKSNNFDKVVDEVRKGADVNVIDAYGQTPLAWALDKGYEQISLFLLKNGSLIDVDIQGIPLIMFATGKHCNQNILKILTEKGAGINSVDKNTGISLLMNAVQSKRINCMKFLINKGANINAQDNIGFTALHHAVVSGEEESVRILMKAGASALVKEKSGYAPIDMAVKYNKSDLVKIMNNRSR